MDDKVQLTPEMVELLNKSKLVDELMGNPEVRKDFLGVVKKFNPKVRIPELDTPNEVNETVVKPLVTKIEKLEKELDEERGIRVTESRAQKMRDAGLDPKVDAEDFNKFKSERTIGDYDQALELYSVVRRANAPSHYAQTSALELPNMDGLFADPTHWSRKTAHEVINEIVANRHRR